MSSIKISTATSREPGSDEPVSAITPRSRRLRARRLRVEDLGLRDVTAHGSHAALGEFDAVVEDLSVYGMALVLPMSEMTMSLLAGDRLEALHVLGGATTIYRGSAMVRHIAERDANVVLGVELQESGLDLAELYRRSERVSFAQRLSAAHRGTLLDDVAPEFKTGGGDLRTYLEAMKGFLDDEERPLETLDLLTREETRRQYLEEAAPVLVERMNRAAEELSDLVSGFRPEEHGVHRAFLRKQLLP